jgi:CspA family cold shock protein
MARGQTQKAEMAFAEAVRLGPPDPYKHYNYGKALLKNGHPEKALEQLEKSDRLDPGKDYVQVYKARACMALHDFRRAENYLGRIPSHRRKGYVWYSIGELRLAKGDPTAAVDALRRATALDSNSHNSHFLLGMASEQCGSLAEASAAYSAAVKLRMQRYHLHFPEAEKRLAAVQAMVSSNEAATPAPNPPSEPEGHIKSFKEKRGYGFIAVQEGADLFFHVSEVINPEAIIVGAPVTFEVVDTHKGPRATNVSVV